MSCRLPAKALRGGGTKSVYQGNARQDDLSQRFLGENDRPGGGEPPGHKEGMIGALCAVLLSYEAETRKGGEPLAC